MRFTNTIALPVYLLAFTALTGCAGGRALGGLQQSVSQSGNSPNAASRPTSTSTAGAASGASPTTTAPAATTEPVAPTPAGSHTLTFVNNCAQTVWVGALTNSKEFALPESGGWQLDQGQQHSIVLAGHWGGRFWGRTGCTTTDGVFKCESGDCGGAACDGRGGQPASLAEFLLFDDAGKDFYDVSLVDAFNLPIGIAPSKGSVDASQVSGQTCGAPTCATDIDSLCPAELQQKNAQGQTVSCDSACSAYNTPQTCCTGAYDTAPMCPATPLSKVFKTACPDAYSYAYDDKTSTYNCTAKAYTVTFCPSAQVAP